jgi:hypothetical protein
MGHNYLMVFADLMTKSVLFGVPVKGTSVWVVFAVDLPPHYGHPKPIQDVAIEISAVSTQGVRDNLENARVV